jgi:hypothetical protein
LIVGLSCTGVEDDVQAPFRGQLLAPLRHQRHLVRLDGERDLQHLLGGGHLQVQPRLHHLAQDLDVAVLDVPAVAAEVDGDPVRAAELGQDGRVHGIGLRDATGLTDGGDVVDVDAEARHDRSIAARWSARPGRAASCAYSAGAPPWG